MTDAIKKIQDYFDEQISNGAKLSGIDPGETFGLNQQEADDLLTQLIVKISDLQHRLVADQEWSLLIVLQAVDTGGKDGIIRNVMTGVNPQGFQIFNFKKPSNDELRHDFLWRCVRDLPERGKIGIFNRSYYEEVLVVKINKENIDNQKIPKMLVTPYIWDERYEDINNFEKHLIRNGTIICKFFMHISEKEQKNRIDNRLSIPQEHWKFATADLESYRKYNEFTKVHQDMIDNTCTEYAPWWVIPSDNKWVAHVAAAVLIIDALESMDLKFPVLEKGKVRNLKKALNNPNVKVDIQYHKGT